MTAEQLDQIYRKLSSPDFANPATGNLTFPIYTYVYDPQYENELASTLERLSDHLIRPTAYVETLVIDIFDFFLTYLKNKSFGNYGPFLDYLLKKEPENPDNILRILRSEATSESFFQALDGEIKSFLESPGEYNKSYVFIYGIGKIYPYLRCGQFISNMERYVQGYKLIIFYPGTHNTSFSLFGKLGERPYRPTKLINS